MKKSSLPLSEKSHTVKQHKAPPYEASQQVAFPQAEWHWFEIPGSLPKPQILWAWPSVELHFVVVMEQLLRDHYPHLSFTSYINVSLFAWLNFYSFFCNQFCTYSSKFAKCHFTIIKYKLNGKSVVWHPGSVFDKTNAINNQRNILNIQKH